MAYTILSSTPARHVPLVAGLLAIATIAICYTVATSLGHVPRWLPDITHCAQYRPEQYIFRVGMLPACTLMWKLWFLVYDWLRALSLRATGTYTARISAARTLGCAGATLLIIASSVISPNPMPWTLHIFGATGFFICTGIAQLLVVRELGVIVSANPTLVNSTSLNVKRSLLSFLLMLAVLSTVNGIVPLPLPKSFPFGAVVEWLAVIAVLSYNFTIWKWDWSYMEVATTADPPQNFVLTAAAAYSDDEKAAEQQKDCTLTAEKQLGKVPV